MFPSNCDWEWLIWNLLFSIEMYKCKFSVVFKKFVIIWVSDSDKVFVLFAKRIFFIFVTANWISSGFSVEMFGKTMDLVKLGFTVDKAFVEIAVPGFDARVVVLFSLGNYVIFKEIHVWKRHRLNGLVNRHRQFFFFAFFWTFYWR